MARNFVAASSQYLEAASSPITGVNVITLACWFRPTTVVSNSLLGVGRAATVDDYFVIGNTGAGAVYIEVNGSSGQSATGGNVTAGVWNHVCGVQASATSRTAYLNGTPGTTNTTSNGTAPAALDRTIVGANIIAGSRLAYANGDIADCAIWNVALTTAEIVALSRGVHPRRIRPAALVFFAPLWGTSSPERDYTAGQRHLTITGATAVAAQPRTGPLFGGDAWLPAIATGGGGGTPHTQNVDDGLSITDNVGTSTTSGHTQTVDDSISGTDAVSKQPGKALADAAEVTDSGMAVDTGYSIADSATVTDQATSAAGYARSVADTGTVTDSLNTGGSTGHTQTVDDTISGTDALARDITRPIDDTGTLTDAQQRDLARGIDDAASVTDATATVAQFARTLGDAGTLTDTIDNGSTVAHSHAVNDTATVTDAISPSRDVSTTAADSATVTDALTRAWDATVGPADSGSLGDAVAISWGATHTILDSATISESVDGIGDPIIVYVGRAEPALVTSGRVG